ncbi:MAG TPA: sulfite exporter TauE/SafE family protein [Tepidisphaeraceae bacterium]|jgi:hypothetical protein
MHRPWNETLVDPTTAYILVVIFVATLIRSTLGFGEALVAVPLLALRLPVTIAAPLAVLISVLVAAVIVVQDWRQIELRSARWLILSSLLGIPLGLLLLARTNDHVVKMILGLIIVCFSAYSLAAKSRLHLKHDHPLWLLGSGFCSGILGGAYGMNGPPLAIYGSLRRWSPQQFRATLQGYFLAASVVGLLGYAWLGLWGPMVTKYFLLSLPGVLLAIIIGRALNNRLRDEGFFRFVYAGLFVIGAVLFVQAFSN